MSTSPGSSSPSSTACSRRRSVRILLAYPPAAAPTGGVQTWVHQLRAAWSGEVVAVVEPRYGTWRATGVLGAILLNLEVVVAALRLRPDLVVCGHVAVAPGAWAARVLGRVPYAALVHGTEVRGRTVWRSPRVTAALLDGAAAVVANSGSTRSRLRALGVRGEVLVRPPGVDADRFVVAGRGTEARARWGLPAGVMLLTVARLVAHKGHDTVIRALPGIRAQLPDAHYVIAGHGPRRAALGDLARALGVGDAVRFLGYVGDDELPDLYRAADVFVLVSSEDGDAVEGYGIALLEAGCAGLPVVGSRSGGIPDAVVEGVTGVLVDPLDVPALVDAVAAVVAEPDGGARFGEAASRLAASEWSAPLRARRLLEDLSEVAAGSHRPVGTASSANRPVKVCFVNDSGEIGGAERSLLTLLDEMGRLGLPAATVVAFHDGPFVEALSSRDVRVVRCPLPETVGRLTRLYRGYGPRDYARAVMAGAVMAARLRKVLNDEQPTLVHTNSVKAHVLAGVAARSVGIPVVWHVRDILPAGRARRTLDRFGATVPAAIIVNSAATGAQFAHRRSVAKVVRIDNAVDLDRFQPRPAPEQREAWGFDPGCRVVGMVAHLTPWKGHEDFLRAAAWISAKDPDVRFVVVGGDIYGTDGHAGYPSRLRSVAAELGLAELVRFEAATDDVPGVLNALDVVVHPPALPEPFGRVLIEAMACARPLVATRVGGIPEVVRDGDTGVLVPASSPEELGASVVELLADPERCARMGARGRATAVERFAPERMARAVLDVYQSVLGGRWAGAAD